MKWLLLFITLCMSISVEASRLSLIDSDLYKPPPPSKFQRPEDILDVIPVVRYLRVIKYRNILLKVEPKEVKLHYRVRRKHTPNALCELYLRVSQASGQSEFLVETPIGYSTAVHVKNTIIYFPYAYSIGIKPHSDGQSHNSLWLLARTRV